MDDIVGTTIGIFEVEYLCDFKSNDGHKMYHVRCTKCGFETNMQKRHIGSAAICNHQHANWKTDNIRLHIIFNGMKSRCYDENDRAYRWYGAKCVKICNEWLDDPTKFEDWAINNGYKDNLTINRKNENEDYCPENCEWITLEDNSRYKSTTSMINVNGEIHSGRDWSQILGLGINTINKYVRKYGLENTINFIKKFQSNPDLKPKHKQSYYDLYLSLNI